MLVKRKGLMQLTGLSLADYNDLMRREILRALDCESQAYFDFSGLMTAKAFMVLRSWGIGRSRLAYFLETIDYVASRGIIDPDLNPFLNPSYDYKNHECFITNWKLLDIDLFFVQTEHKHQKASIREASLYVDQRTAELKPVKYDQSVGLLPPTKYKDIARKQNTRRKL